MATTPATVVMLDPNGNPGEVPAEKASSAQASGYTPAVKMQGPDGSLGYVAQDKVAAARQSNFAVTPDNPGMQKMVSPKGEVNYVLPSETQSFQRAGHTRINPDGSFYLQNIPGEDPLAEQQRYVRVKAALTPQEQAGANRAALKEFATTGVEAGVDTALGVAGASGAGEALPAAEKVLQLTESQLGKFAEAYPHLSKLAGHLGLATGVGGAIEVFRRLFK